MDHSITPEHVAEGERRARGMTTSRLAGDDDALKSLIAGITVEELAGTTLALTAYAARFLAALATARGVSPLELARSVFLRLEDN